MSKKLEIFKKRQLKSDLPDIKPGDTIKVHQRILVSEGKTSSGKAKKGSLDDKEKKERIQVFEGQVIARKHGKGINSTITVRRVTSGVGVERVFPLHSPIIDKIEIIKRAKTRRAKLYYLRKAKGKRARLKKEKLA